jgi:hypothetical protein
MRYKRDRQYAGCERAADQRGSKATATARRRLAAHQPRFPST